MNDLPFLSDACVKLMRRGTHNIMARLTVLSQVQH